MNVLVVVESSFGNTSRVAQAIAGGLRTRGASVTVSSAAEAGAFEAVDLLLVGAPTHNMGLPGPKSRRVAESKGGNSVQSGVSEWLDALPKQISGRAAAFDTVTGRGFFSGSAAKQIDKHLRRRGATVKGREGFIVSGTQGPVADGELKRAEEWGASLI